MSSEKLDLNKLSKALRRHPKTVGGIGILTTCGLILYEKHKIQQFLSKFVRTNGTEKTDKKRPDYIYIKYHIYKESMRKLKQKEEEDKKWINVIINPIGKWWKSFKHSVAWRLLKIAQTGSQQERLKATRQLASIDHLKDWDFQHLAQLCDSRTAVSLARSGADVRWFLPPPMHGCIKNPKIVLTDFHALLSKLRPNSCVDNFFSKYFPEQDSIEDVDEFFTHEQSQSLSAIDTDLLKEVISFLHHITKEPEIGEKILKDGGITHLMELRKIFAGDNETLSTLCKIMANISLAKDSVEHFFSSGWISVLADWQRGPDLRLQVIAAKTLANLDHDDPFYTEYPPNVYPLYPRLRTRTPPKADIVFIHGLMGGVFITWRQKDRQMTELGLYGKNAFYTSETDDVFLVGEQRKAFLRNRNGNGNGNGNGNSDNNKKYGNSNGQINGTQGLINIEAVENKMDPESVLKAATKLKKKPIQISDVATKELVEELQSEAELDSDWEVVHPDIPLKAGANSDGEFSVAGNQWLNQDHSEDYTNCWPMEWLPEDHPNARVIGIDYTSALSEWSINFTKYCPCEKGQGHIDVRATSLLERIAKSDVGLNERPVVWIGHSMGGLLTKLILTKAIESNDPKMQQLAKSTSGIVFLGTPHRGSPIAKWKQHMQMILSPSIEVKEMEEGAPKLLDLHQRFMTALQTHFRKVKVVSIAEGAPTMLTTFKFPLRIVTEESANINYGDFYILKDDHLSLSKPIFRQSFLYQRLLTVIDECVNRKGKIEEKEDNLADTESNLNVIQNQIKPAKPNVGAQNNKTNTKSIFLWFPQIPFKFLASFMDA